MITRNLQTSVTNEFRRIGEEKRWWVMRLVIGQLWADLENERHDEISSSVAGFISREKLLFVKVAHYSHHVRSVGSWAVESQQSTIADGSFDHHPLKSILEYALDGYMQDVVSGQGCRSQAKSLTSRLCMKNTCSGIVVQVWCNNVH